MSVLLSAADPQKLCALPCCPPTGGVGLASSIAAPAASTAPAAEAPQSGPPTMGLVVSCVDRMARDTRDRPTRNRHRLAPARLPGVLVLEEWSPGRSAGGA